MTKTTADTLRLTAADGHSFAVYRSVPADGKARGALVVIQEIFGVNRHIRNVADRFAAKGYVALAPALFDRLGPQIELTYTPEGVAKGRELKGKVPNDKALADISATVDHLKQQGLKTGLIGFCWGGALAWLAAGKLPLDAVGSFYGGGIETLVGAHKPKVPLQLHYGLKDAHIGAEAREAARGAAPQAEYFEYDADHGFCCDERGSYHQASCEQAMTRVQDLLHREVG